MDPCIFFNYCFFLFKSFSVVDFLKKIIIQHLICWELTFVVFPYLTHLIKWPMTNVYTNFIILRLICLELNFNFFLLAFYKFIMVSWPDLYIWHTHSGLLESFFFKFCSSNFLLADIIVPLPFFYFDNHFFFLHFSCFYFLKIGLFILLVNSFNFHLNYTNFFCLVVSTNSSFFFFTFLKRVCIIFVLCF
jgi:hypothetical protein